MAKFLNVRSGNLHIGGGPLVNDELINDNEFAELMKIAPADRVAVKTEWAKAAALKEKENAAKLNSAAPV